jgi:hypothetical protein
MKESSLVGLNNIQKTRWYYAKFWLVSVFLVAACIAPTAGAIASISQSYTTTEKLSLGSIVSIKKNSSDYVVATSTENSDNMLGVVISDGNSILTYVNGQKSQVQVTTSGMASVLVSDVSGEIKQGDAITASPIKGVGMKATGNSKVIGIAQGEPINSDEKQSYTNDYGVKQSVTLGQVDVLVNVAYYYKQAEKTIIPAAVQNVANALAGKQVSAIPILISAAIFIVMMIVVATIIYSLIKNSIISVGRNPMAQSAVWRDVIQLSLLILAILTVGFISIYLILTRF